MVPEEWFCETAVVLANKSSFANTSNHSTKREDEMSVKKSPPAIDIDGKSGLLLTDLVDKRKEDSTQLQIR